MGLTPYEKEEKWIAKVQRTWSPERKDFDPAKHPRGEGGRFGEGSGSGDSAIVSENRKEENYRGIKAISFAPQGSVDVDLIKENRAVVNSVLDKLPKGAADGLNALYITSGDFTPLGTATYIAPSKQRGYVSDEIMTQQAWLNKSPVDKEASLLHEFGHRMQLVSHKDIFKRFSAQGLGVHFSSLTEPQYQKAYPKKQHDGESFAESFARYKIGKDMPNELVTFWKGTGL